MKASINNLKQNNQESTSSLTWLKREGYHVNTSKNSNMRDSLTWLKVERHYNINSNSIIKNFNELGNIIAEFNASIASIFATAKASVIIHSGFHSINKLQHLK